ncbi:MAG: ester cyclase [Deltaproteobacteria bacterium]|nr:ester cyclase [Deltaproteobacteria bacterium]
MADNKRVAARILDEVWSQGRFEAIEELCDDKFESRMPIVGKVDRSSLKETIGAYRKAFPDLKFEVKDILFEGDKGVIRWVGSGTNKGSFMGMAPTNKFAKVHGVTFVEFKNGKSLKEYVHYDVLTFLDSLGIKLPIGMAPPAPSETRPELRH